MLLVVVCRILISLILAVGAHHSTVTKVDKTTEPVTLDCRHDLATTEKVWDFGNFETFWSASESNFTFTPVDLCFSAKGEKGKCNRFKFHVNFIIHHSKHLQQAKLRWEDRIVPAGEFTFCNHINPCDILRALEIVKIGLRDLPTSKIRIETYISHENSETYTSIIRKLIGKMRRLREVIPQWQVSRSYSYSSSVLKSLRSLTTRLTPHNIGTLMKIYGEEILSSHKKQNAVSAAGEGEEEVLPKSKLDLTLSLSGSLVNIDTGETGDSVVEPFGSLGLYYKGITCFKDMCSNTLQSYPEEENKDGKRFERSIAYDSQIDLPICEYLLARPAGQVHPWLNVSSSYFAYYKSSVGVKNKEKLTIKAIPKGVVPPPRTTTRSPTASSKGDASSGRQIYISFQTSIVINVMITIITTASFTSTS